MAVASKPRHPAAVASERVTAIGHHGLNLHEEKRREASLCVAEGERLGLYTIVGETGPVTIFGLAQDARIPLSLALRWLASQTRSGHIVRDVVTGRYRTWCVLLGPEN